MDVIFSTHLSFKDLLSQDDPDRYQGRSHQKLAEWYKLANHLTLKLDPEKHGDEDMKNKSQLDSSLHFELQDKPDTLPSHLVRGTVLPPFQSYWHAWFTRTS